MAKRAARQAQTTIDLNGFERAVIFSDSHLGKKENEGADLAKFLKHLKDKKQRILLVMNGDIVDFWRCPPLESYLFVRSFLADHVLPLKESGSRLVYVPGNHDYCVRDMLESDTPLGNMIREDLKGIDLVSPCLDITVPKGGKVLVCHGDVSDFYHIFELIGDLCRSLDDWKSKSLFKLLKKLKGEHVRFFYRWILNRDESDIRNSETFFDQPFPVQLNLLMDFFQSKWLEEIDDGSAKRRAAGRAGAPSVLERAAFMDYLKDLLKRILEEVLSRLNIVGFDIAEIDKYIVNAVIEKWLVVPGDIKDYLRIIIGHRHDPRPEPNHWRSKDRNPHSRVYDDGCWVEREGLRNTFVDISSEKIALKRFTESGKEEMVMEDALSPEG
jgi:UDP-2,3-diacylglucosamine pyrophosphatase LpxH